MRTCTACCPCEWHLPTQQGVLVDKSLGIIAHLQRSGVSKHPQWVVSASWHAALWAVSVQALHDPLEEMEALAAASGIKGCAYCGGLGHRIADCPKLRSESKAQERSKKDYFGSGGFGGEM